MAVAQGQLKRLAFKKQSGLGSAASGSGAQYLRRETAAFNKKTDTYNSNEITSHQQYTGDTYGIGSTEGSLDNVLSVGTYASFMGSAVRRDFAAVSAITSLSLTIAGSGPYTVTRGTGSFLTDGVKIGNVVRITAGTYTGVARDINLLVTGVTALVLTVIVPNGKALAAQGPVASSTVTVMGKTTFAPISGHTNDYYTFEEQYSDLSLNRVYSDVQVGTVEISVPATGNSTVKLSMMGLIRAKSGTATFTTPTVETTTSILSAANGIILLNGAKSTVGTSFNGKIENGLAKGEATIGSNSISDMVKGDIKFSGTVTAVHDGETTSDYYVNQTAIGLVCALFVDGTDTSDFFVMGASRAKLFSDDIDDGKKQLVATYNFTAEIDPAGGAALASNQTTVFLQDSQA